jgi:hypothetical protein
MKKLNLFTFILAGLFVFASCEETMGPTLSEDVQEPSFTNSPSGQSFVLSEDAKDEVAFELEWSRPDFGFSSAAMFTVQMAEAGTEFEESESLGETNSNSFSMTVGALNSTMLGAGFPADMEAEIEVRVMTVISEDVDTLYTSPISMTVTPYLVDAGLPDLLNMYFVGDATSAGWNNDNNNMPMVRLPDSEENNFTFTGRFAGGTEFKLLETLGAWQPQWGDNGGALASNEDLGGDPGSLVITAGDGYYTVGIDIEARTYSIGEYDESSAATYTTIGLIGDATPNGWDSDTDLTQSSFDSHIWYINDIELTSGEAKFRAENDWATNWGANTEFSGFGSIDGPNIPVSPGTYNVWFNDLDGSYIFIPVQE